MFSAVALGEKINLPRENHKRRIELKSRTKTGDNELRFLIWAQLAVSTAPSPNQLYFLNIVKRTKGKRKGIIKMERVSTEAVF